MPSQDLFGASAAKLIRVVRARRGFSKKHPRFWYVILAAVVYLLFFGVAWWRLDSDFGWHLQAGNYIRAHGIPAHDIFTYTARQFRWIDHEWGNDVIVSLLYNYGNYLLTAAVFAGLWTTAVLVAGRGVSFFTLFLGSLALLPYAGIRPMVWSLLGLAILLKLCAGKKPRTKYFIPLIFIPWANLHAGFVIGLAYLGYLTVAKRSRTWALILVVSTLATFVNAYGPRLYVEIFRTLTDSSLHTQINEWKAFNIIGPTYPYILVWLAGFWLFSKNKITNWLRFDTLLIAAGFSSSRNLTLFVIASLSNADAYLKKALSQIPKHLDRPRKFVLAGLVAMAAASIFYGLKVSYWPFAPRESGYPAQAVAYLQANGCPGNLFNDYNYGGYLIWKLPSQPVYIDGRMPSWRAPDGVKYLDTYLLVISNKQTREQQFKQYDIKCVLMGRSADGLAMIRDLQKTGWKTVVTANGSDLLIKS